MLGKKINFTKAKKPSKNKLIGNYVILEPLNITKHTKQLFDNFSLDKKNKIWNYLSYGPFINIKDFKNKTDVICAANVICHVPDLVDLIKGVDVLLSKTWIVPDLPCAIRLYQKTKTHNFRFVTRNGEMIDGNGNVQVGVGNNGMGPIVRNSELREMGARITLLESQIETQSIIYQRQQNDIAECESTQRTLQNDLDRERENLALRKVDQEQTNHKIDQLQEQYDIDRKSTRLNYSHW